MENTVLSQKEIQRAYLEINKRKETILVQCITQNGGAITQGARIRFSYDTTELRHITSIEINVPTALGANITNINGTGLIGVYWQQLTAYTLTLVDNNDEHLVDQMPLTCFANDIGAGNPGTGLRGKIKIFDCVVNMAKSFITYNYNFAVNPALCIPVTFGYLQ